MLEAHARSNKDMGRFRGCGQRFRRDAWTTVGCGDPYRDTNKDDQVKHGCSRSNNYSVKHGQWFQWNRDKGKKLAEKSYENICNRCGMTGHLAKVCVGKIEFWLNFGKIIKRIKFIFSKSFVGEWEINRSLKIFDYIVENNRWKAPLKKMEVF